MRDDLKYDTKMYEGELELSIKLHYQIHDLGHTVRDPCTRLGGVKNVKMCAVSLTKRRA